MSCTRRPLSRLRHGDGPPLNRLSSSPSGTPLPRRPACRVALSFRCAPPLPPVPSTATGGSAGRRLQLQWAYRLPNTRTGTLLAAGVFSQSERRKRQRVAARPSLAMATAATRFLAGRWDPSYALSTSMGKRCPVRLDVRWTAPRKKQRGSGDAIDRRGVEQSPPPAGGRPGGPARRYLRVAATAR